METKTPQKTLQLDGRVAVGPELKTSKANKPYFTAKLVSDQDDGESVWVSIVAFGSFAENLATRVKKGSLLRVKGKLKVSEYNKKDGSVGVDNTIMLDKVTLEGGDTITPFDGPGVSAF